MSKHRTGSLHTPVPAADSGAFRLGWLLYLVFIVYGSLVPLDFHALPLDQAWAQFRQLPMLQIGAEGRADWVANGVLYVPAGFLTVVVLGGGKGGLWRRFPRLAGAALFCIALALAVEFTQLFFPQRTFSRNDVIAEVIGSLVGILLAANWSDWFSQLLASWVGTLDQLLVRALQAYAVGYLVFSLFPFDFMISAGEFAGKLNADGWGWFLAGQTTERGAIVLAAKLLAEMLAVVPVGAMLGRRNQLRGRSATVNALLYGGLLGLAIEAIQFLMFSGVSQGASLLTRIGGMYLGALFWQERRRFRDLPNSGVGKRLAPWLGLLYLPALVAVNGWFDHSWHGLELAGKTVAETRFLPFYYHYYTTEQAALLSVAAVALMYAPIGGLAWLRRLSPAVAFWLALLVAGMIETSKLFLAGFHPDPTNLLIAAFAAWSLTSLLRQFYSAVADEVQQPEERPVKVATTTAEPARIAVSSWFSLAGTLALAAWVAVDFPIYSLLLAVLLLAYAALLWFRPQLLWMFIPAALPLLDLAPWSGRFFLDEFDFLVMVSLALGYVRTRALQRGVYRDWWALAVTGLLALTLTISALRGGLLPLSLPDVNAFTNYYSPYNALRAGKGALWALLLFGLIRRFEADGRDIRGLFAGGMVVGLAGIVAVVVWERAVFPGLFNFADVYRVTGPFSQMHTGGADIEVYLTAAVPFVVLLVMIRTLWARLVGILLFPAATYALMVTFSRAGYAGYGIALAGACLVILLSPRKGPEPGAPPVHANHAKGLGVFALSRWALPVGLLALAVVVALPIYSGSFAQERLSQVRADLAVRQAHWADTLAMRDSGLASTLFGMGFGRFPERHYWRSSEPRAASYRLESEAGNVFLRLGAGLSLYMEQLVTVQPHRDYVLHLALRSSQPVTLSASLCEKWLLTSGRCVFGTAASEGRQWEEHQIRLASGEVGAGSGLLHAPVKLSLQNTSAASLDLDNVRLLNEDGADLTDNGGFSRALDRWFFSVDDDLPWHVWSMPVAILFEQGVIGLLAFAVMLLLGVWRTGRRARQGDIMAGCFLASLLGVLFIGSVDSIIDSPRFLLLLLLLCRVGWMWSETVGVPAMRLSTPQTSRY